MDKDGKQKSHTQIVPVRQKRLPPRKWQLTEADKRFLRNCNICPN